MVAAAASVYSMSPHWANITWHNWREEASLNLHLLYCSVLSYESAVFGLYYKSFWLSDKIGQTLEQRVTGRYKPTLFLPLWFAPSVSLVVVKLHSIFRAAAQQGCLSECVCVCLHWVCFHYSNIFILQWRLLIFQPPKDKQTQDSWIIQRYSECFSAELWPIKAPEKGQTEPKVDMWRNVRQAKLSMYCTHQSFDDPKCCALDSGSLCVHVCMQHMWKASQTGRWQTVITLSSIQLDQ